YMKKLLMIFALMMSVQILQAEPLNKDSKNNDKKEVKLTEEEQAQVDEMKARLDEIKAMDFANMSREEKKEIREELKEMKAVAREGGKGIYLSVGAIIIIILLLILI